MRPITENGQTIALQALAWLVSNDELRPVFMGASGAGEDDLRQGAHDPEFLGAVLDFLLMDDAWVLDFTQTHALPGEAVMQARMTLPGADMMNWT